VAPPLVVSVHIITYLDDIIKDIELVSNKIFESKKMDVVRLGGDVFALLHKFRMRQLNIHSIFPSPLFHLYVSH
jgi:glutamine synthetase type III